MKIESETKNSAIFESLQRKNSTISSLEETFAKLQVDKSPTELLEIQLKDLNLDDDKGKLLERGPLTTKDTKPPKSKPYRKVAENVYLRHNCGGTFFSVKNTAQQNYNNINNSFTYNNHSAQNFETNSSQSTCIECFNFFKSETCVLHEVNTPEFIEFSSRLLKEIEQNENNSLQLQHTQKETELNISNVSHTLTSDQINESTTNDCQNYPVFIVPQERRTSHDSSSDSGFQSDIPSPLSDSVLSPKPIFTLQPRKTETATPNYRKILPKTVEMQKNKDNNSVTLKNKSIDTKQKDKIVTDATEKSAKELFRTTLNEDIKRVKWIELVVQKNNEEVFGMSCRGQTILHKLLQSDDKYMAESFYAIVERMKINPTKCSRIVAAESSICNLIKQNKRPQLWLDYFSEAIKIIQDTMASSQ